MMTLPEHAPVDPHVWPWWRHLLLHVAIWCTIGVIFAVQLAGFGVATWDVAFRIAAVDWCPWILFGPLTFWFGQKIEFTRRRWQLPALIHLAACIGVAFMIEVIASTALELNWVRFPDRPPEPPAPGQMEPPRAPPPELIGPLRDPGPGGPPRGFGSVGTPPGRRPDGRPDRPFVFRAGRARVSIPIYWILVTSAHAFIFHRRALERERRALQAEARLVEARLSALQAQLNPHFLFNTLNAVVHYVRADPDAAEEMITNLSELLRSVLAYSDRREVRLEQELAFVDHYLAIQRVRFNDRLTVDKDIAPAALQAAVPTLILQPLVENAVIHGVAPERTAGTVHVRARVAGSRLHIEVADTGKGMTGRLSDSASLAFKEGVGLSNTRARLAALYGTDFHFQISPAPEGGVCVKLEIPLRVSPAT